MNLDRKGVNRLLLVASLEHRSGLQGGVGLYGKRIDALAQLLSFGLVRNYYSTRICKVCWIGRKKSLTLQPPLLSGKRLWRICSPSLGGRRTQSTQLDRTLRGWAPDSSGSLLGERSPNGQNWR